MYMYNFSVRVCMLQLLILWVNFEVTSQHRLQVTAESLQGWWYFDKFAFSNAPVHLNLEITNATIVQSEKLLSGFIETAKNSFFQFGMLEYEIKFDLVQTSTPSLLIYSDYRNWLKAYKSSYESCAYRVSLAETIIPLHVNGIGFPSDSKKHPANFINRFSSDGIVLFLPQLFLIVLIMFFLQEN